MRLGPEGRWQRLCGSLRGLRDTSVKACFRKGGKCCTQGTKRPEQEGRGGWRQRPSRWSRRDEESSSGGSQPGWGREVRLLKGLLLLLLGEAQGTDPIFLHCPWAQCQCLSGRQSIMCGEGIGVQNIGKKGLADARSVLECFHSVPVCFSTRINN